MQTFSVLDLITKLPRQIEIGALGQLFAQDGVVVFPNWLSESERMPLRQAMNDFFQPMRESALERCNGGNKEFNAKFACDVISWDPVMEKNAALIHLSQSPTLHQLTEAVLGPDFSEPGKAW